MAQDDETEETADRAPLDARVFLLSSGVVWEVEAVWPQNEAARLVADAALRYYRVQRIAAGDGPEAMRARAAILGLKGKWDQQVKVFREVKKKEGLPEVQYAVVAHIFNRPNGRVEIIGMPFGPWEAIGIGVSTSIPVDEVMVDTVWGVNALKDQIAKLIEEAESAGEDDDDEESDEEEEETDEEETEVAPDAQPTAAAPATGAASANGDASAASDDDDFGHTGPFPS
jgi:hypothetical protein